MPKTLILWSGGIDSTAILKQYLEKTDDEIIALHVFYQKKKTQLRPKQEAKSIQKLLPTLQKIRNFQFHESQLIYDLPVRILDAPTLGLHAIPIANLYKADSITFGFISDYTHLSGISHEEYLDHFLCFLNQSTQSLARLNQWEKIPSFTLPKFYATKKEYIQTIKNLIYLTWFCRTPKNARFKRGCGKCNPCKHVQRSADPAILQQLFKIKFNLKNLKHILTSTNNFRVP